MLIFCIIFFLIIKFVGLFIFLNIIKHKTSNSDVDRTSHLDNDSDNEWDWDWSGRWD